MAGSLDRAKSKILEHLESSPGGVFTLTELRAILAQHSEEWALARSISARKFIEFLVEKRGLQVIELRSEEHGRVIRYARKGYSPHVVALSLRPRSYLSHGTAVFLHGLNEQLPKTIYVNQEQTEKPRGSKLTQERLTLAFSRRQRASSYIFSMEGNRVVLLNGKHTGRLGVVKLNGPMGEELSATNVARTLIDIVVRPAYAGGVVQVLEAYRGAKGRVEAAEILRTLKNLDYVYPYHQSIGFLMERAGYEASEWRKLLSLGTKFDFFLTHGMKDPKLDEKWRLFFPKGI